MAALALPEAHQKTFQYDRLRWVDESQDPSITLETGDLVAKVIDNTGLRPRPGKHPMEHAFTHHLGYHGIRALWHKEERRNIVMPFVSWLNLQGLSAEGLDLDPVDSRALFGVGRGWPLVMEKQGPAVKLAIPRMPASEIEYSIRLAASGVDSLDFEITFTLHKKTRKRATFFASWPCYMSTYDEVELFAPVGDPTRPEWKAFGEREPFVTGDPVNFTYSQRRFSPVAPAVLPVVYGRIGRRVLAVMASRPEVTFFLVNAGGHLSFLPVQNPAWDLAFNLPDYEPGVPFGFRGRLIYKVWNGSEEILSRYQTWVRGLA